MAVLDSRQYRNVLPEESGDPLEGRKCVVCQKTAVARCFGLKPKHYACIEHTKYRGFELCDFCYEALMQIRRGLSAKS